MQGCHKTNKDGVSNNYQLRGWCDRIDLADKLRAFIFLRQFRSQFSIVVALQGLFTTASLLCSERFFSKTLSYLSRSRLSCVQVLSGRMESGSSLTDAECWWRVDRGQGGLHRVVHDSL